jgi:uncharacterized membrane protein YgdD (TMEM256/DUF423 family)
MSPEESISHAKIILQLDVKKLRRTTYILTGVLYASAVALLVAGLIAKNREIAATRMTWSTIIFFVGTILYLSRVKFLRIVEAIQENCQLREDVSR